MALEVEGSNPSGHPTPPPRLELRPWSEDADVTQDQGVRKQYHFWPGERGLDAWDVDRLIALSVHLPVVDVSVDDIREVDSAYWYGVEEQPTVRSVVDHWKLALDVDLSHPIILGPDGRVLDGMHRIARSILEGRRMIRAVRLPMLPDPDYRDCAPADLPY